jgi:hypothetical protein
MEGGEKGRTVKSCRRDENEDKRANDPPNKRPRPLRLLCLQVAQHPLIQLPPILDRELAEDGHRDVEPEYRGEGACFSSVSLVVHTAHSPGSSRTPKLTNPGKSTPSSPTFSFLNSSSGSSSRNLGQVHDGHAWRNAAAPEALVQ